MMYSMKKTTLLSVCLLLVMGCSDDKASLPLPSNLSYTPFVYQTTAGEELSIPAPSIDGAQPITFSLESGHDHFNIDAATGAITLPLNNGLETGVHTVDVAASNASGSTTFQKVVRVTVGKRQSIPPTVPASLADKGYQLVWNDEFDGTQLDLTKWNHRYPGTLRGYATNSKDNVVMNGNGTLSLLLTESEGKYYIGMIGTQNLYSVKYGYFECRAKLQKSIGPHTSFWLQSAKYGQSDNPSVDGAEVDIFEYLVNYPKTIYQTVHWNAYNSSTYTKVVASPKIDGLAEGYHTFGMEWTLSGYTFYVDGVKTSAITQGISKVEQYLILSLSLNSWGGKGDGSDLNTSNKDKWTVPDQIVFDYVRVFQVSGLTN